jgi:hypothetical protein
MVRSDAIGEGYGLDMVEFLEILVLVKFIQKERALNVAVT